MKRLTCLLAAAFALVLGTGFSGSPEWRAILLAQEIQIETTGIQRDPSGKVFRYEDARFRAGDIFLDARLIEVDLEKNVATATGDVRYRNKGIAGTAERLEIDLDDNTVTLFGANLFDMANGVYLSAGKIVRLSEDRYIATDCTLTTCAPREGGWTLEVGELDYRTNDFATGSSVVLRLGPVPVGWFPYFAWPTVRERRSGFLAPEISTESSSRQRLDLGARLRVPYFLALGNEHDLTITPDLIEERGAGLELDYNYAFWARQKGRLRLFRIDESRARLREEEVPVETGGIEPLSGAFKPTRQTLDWRHNQGFDFDQRLIMTAAQSSDGQVRREYLHLEDFRPHQEYEASYSVLGPWGDLAATASHGSEYVDESIFANSAGFADGKFRAKLLPRITYATGGRPFSSSSLGLNFTGRVTNFSTEEVVSGRVSEATPSLSYPLRLGGSWELRPTLARRFVQFEDLSQNLSGLPEGRIPAEAFAQTQYGLELRVPFARLFVEGEKATTGIKHRFVPRLIYLETEDVAQPLSGSLSLADAADFASSGQDLAAGVVPPLYTQRLLTFRLDNTWLKGGVKRGDVSAREWIRFDFIQRYNLLAVEKEPSTVGPAPAARQETDSGEPLLPAILEGAINGRGITFDFLLHYHHQLNTFNTTEFSVSGKASPRGKMKIELKQNDFSYRTPDNRLIPAVARFKLASEITASDTILLGFSASVNVRDTPAPLGRRLEKGVAFVEYKPGCYALRATYSEGVSFTLVGGEPEFFVDRRVVFTFDIGGLIEASKTQELSGGS